MNKSTPATGHGGVFSNVWFMLLVMFFVLVLGAYFMAHEAIQRTNALLFQYTETNSVPFPKIELSETDMNQLRDRVAAFQSGVQAHVAVSPLVLTAAEVNALIAGNPNLAPIKNMVNIKFEGDEIKAQVSFPMDGLPTAPITWLDFKGRFVNGNGAIKIRIQKGTLSVFLDSLETHGKKAPPEFLGLMQNQDLLHGFNLKPEAAILERNENVEVKNGVLIVRAGEN